MTIAISTSVNEESAVAVLVTFTDQDGAIHGPSAMNTARWQLSDVDGAVINDRTFENGLFDSNPIVLTGDDLVNLDSGPCRRFAVKVVYSATSGIDIQGTEEASFEITDLVNIG